MSAGRGRELRRNYSVIKVNELAPGRTLEDASFINTTGMVMRVGIRRPGQPPLAFFERGS